MPNTAPHPLTPAEWAELFPLIGEMWGAENAEELAQLAYGVRFDFSSSMPGYYGDLFIIAGDVIETPAILTRDENGALRFSDSN